MDDISIVDGIMIYLILSKCQISIGDIMLYPYDYEISDHHISTLGIQSQCDMMIRGSKKILSSWYCDYPQKVIGSLGIIDFLGILVGFLVRFLR